MKLLNLLEEMQLLHGQGRDVEVGQTSQDGARVLGEAVEECTVQQHAGGQSSNVASDSLCSEARGDIDRGEIGQR